MASKLYEHQIIHCLARAVSNLDRAVQIGREAAPKNDCSPMIDVGSASRALQGVQYCVGRPSSTRCYTWKTEY